MSNDTIKRAYANVPKEPSIYVDIDAVLEFRGLRYYLIRCWRFFTR